MEEPKKRRGRNIPGEIVEEILVKLPVKSLLRFKAVSKEWRGTIESTYFVEKHTDYHKSLVETQARIMLLKRKARYNRLALENLLVSDKEIIPVSRYRSVRSFNRLDGHKISEPCDGLFCLYNGTRIFKLVNPVTTSRRELPDPTPTMVDDPTIVDGTQSPHVFHGANMVMTLLGIGREKSVSRRYKVVWVFECDNKRSKESIRCMVFALDSNTWRYVDPPPCRFAYGEPLIHLDGVMYCFNNCMERSSPTEHDLNLLTFDLHTETFQSFPITADIWPRKSYRLRMLALNHRLCICKRSVNVEDHIFKIWGLNINKKTSWEIIYSIDFSCFSPEYKKWGIIPIVTINDYLIITNSRDDILVLDGSKGYIMYHMMSPPNQLMKSEFVKPYFETLVSPY